MMALAAHGSVIHHSAGPQITQYSSVPESKLVEISPAVTTVEAVEVRSAPAPVVEVRSAPAQVVQVRSAAPAQVGVYADHTKPEVVSYSVKSAPSPVVYSSQPAAISYSAPSPVVYSAPQQQILVKSAPAPVVYAASHPHVVYQSAPQPQQYVSVKSASPIVYASQQPAAVSYSAPSQVVVKSAPAPVVYQSAQVVEQSPALFRSASAYDYDTEVIEAAPVAPIAVAAAAPVQHSYVVKQTPAVVAAVQGEAKYTAVNRGALHEAPLPGHSLSQTSVNLEPAA